MTAHAVPGEPRRGRSRSVFTGPFTVLVALVAAATGFICYVLWPTWPSEPVALDAPALPVEVAGVLFEVPPAAIRVAIQRHSGPQERLDLAFAWPSLAPPADAAAKDDKAVDPQTAAAAAPARLFVTIAGLGAVLPPLERLRSIYPRYVEAQASAGADGLAILPFRAGTPYESEDLVYVGASPEQFFARCTRTGRTVAGTCIHERAVGAAVITFRFPRDWLTDWRGVAAGFDRLTAQLHPGGK
jgi:hypothetical protein